MEHEFWQSKWAAKEIGFHNPVPHPLLTAHLSGFDLADAVEVVRAIHVK